MNQYQVTTQARHLRYICFVEHNYGYEAMFHFMNNCLRKWGGRYVPIIPVHNNVIAEEYQNVIQYLDPDYIIYSSNVDVDVIKKTNLFNPVEFIELDEKGSVNNFYGLYSLYLISEYTQGMNFLVSQGLSNIDANKIDFYKINFGLVTSDYAGDDKLLHNCNKIVLDKDNINDINKIIHLQKPVLRSYLSQQKIDSVVLRSKDHIPYNITELVVSKEAGSTADLLYFWNRKMFECNNVIYCTENELVELCKDPYFGGLLYDQSVYEHPIEVVSRTLSMDEVSQLIERLLKPIAFNRSFKCRQIEKFPFEIMDTGGHFLNKEGYYELGYNEKPITQTLISEKGHLRLPIPSFVSNDISNLGKWAIDLRINKVASDSRDHLKFPLTTYTGYMVKEYKGRINASREVTLIAPNIWNKSVDAILEVPSSANLLRQLVMQPVIQGELKQTKFKDLGPHDSSNRLAAFLRIFDNNFEFIEEIFDDKYWVSVFEELCTSNKIAGDAIAFDELIKKCVQVLPQAGIKIGSRESTRMNVDNLRLGIKNTVQELCQNKSIILGFKLKCIHCASIFWYPIRIVSDVVNCSGCLQDFPFPAEQPFAYKLNDVIKNNIYQSKTQRDGNLTVIRTLTSLRTRARSWFSYSPQVNLYDDYASKKPCAELDVVAFVDGLFIIGEAKHNSKEFKQDGNKSLLSLIEVAKEIRPDQIVLSCYEDSNNRLENAAQFLRHHFKSWDFSPAVKTHLIHEPSYFNMQGYRYFYY